MKRRKLTRREEKPAPRRIPREAEVFDRTGRSRVQRWRDIKAGTFPQPIVLGKNAVGWYEDEIDDWISSRPRRDYGTSAVTPGVARAPEAA